MRHALLSIMTLILLAQLSLAGTGVHQLHLSEQRHDDSQTSHIHLELQATTAISAELSDSDFNELCLDCQCHGGITMMAAYSQTTDRALLPSGVVLLPVRFSSLFPDPSFRPPIA